MNWLDLSNDTIKKGLDSNNNRYLTFFCKDYLATFGIDINNNIGCGKCIDDYINKFKYYLKNEIMSNQEVKKPNTVLYLKDNFSPREIAGRVVDNNTLTNEDVLYVLEKHPTGAWFLEDFHTKFGNADPVLAVENAIIAVKEAIDLEKKSSGKKSKASDFKEIKEDTTEIKDIINTDTTDEVVE